MLYRLLSAFRDTIEGWGIYFVFQLEFRAMAAGFLAFALVLLFGPGLIRWLRAKRIGDTGMTDAEALRQMSASKANTPTMGGILIIGAILISTTLIADVTSRPVLYAIVLLCWLAGLGAFDDWLKLTAAQRGTGSRQGLRAWEKLVFQIGIAVLVGIFLHRHMDSSMDRDLGHALNLPFQSTYVHTEQGFVTNPGLIYLGLVPFVVVAVLMITGMSNAVNITDGMDGLSTGITAAVSVGLLVLVAIAGDQVRARYLLVPYIPDSAELVVLTAAVIGACLGFLWWNCAPAGVFMGDAGSLPLGGVLAYIALVIRQEVLLLLMAMVVLIEIGSVVLQVGFFKFTRLRTGTGRRLFKVAPIHHHFHVLGWTENQVVVRFWIVTLLFVAIGLAMLKVR